MEKDFLDKLKEIYIESYSDQNATRSTKRLKNLHGYISNELKKDELKIISSNLENSSREYRFSGVLGDKNLDISIFDKDNNLFSSIAVKFVFSNYKQNAQNYFEQMVAESLNIKLSNLKSYQLIILRKYTPYFEEGKKNIKKIEEISHEYIIKKYEKYLSIDKWDLVDGVCLMVIDFRDNEIMKKFMSIDKFDFNSFSSEVTKTVNNSKIKVSYPLVEANIKKSINYEDLLKKSIE